MDALTGWLLVLLVSGCLAQSVAILAGRWQFSRLSFLAISGILTLLTVAVFRESVVWKGPTLFALDSFHQVRCHFKVSLMQVPLLWMTWWWMSDRPREQQVAGQFWFLAVLMTFLICDDVWLWMVTFVGCSALQQSLLSSHSRFGGGLPLLRGCHWIATLFLLVVVGILSFDFGIGAFHELPALLQNWENFTETQQADLVLAAMLGSLAIILISAIYPISVLRVDCETDNDLEILSLILAAAVFLKLIPLFVITNVTAIHLPLILLTVVVSTVCSWGFVEASPTRRALLTAFSMLGLFGMFLSDNQVLKHLGLEQFLLVIIMWRLWNSDDHCSLAHRSSILSVGVWSIAGISGWTVALQESGVLGDNETVVSVVMVMLSAGMVVPFCRQISADWQKLPAESHPSRQVQVWGILMIPIFFVVAAIRYSLYVQGEFWGISPGWPVCVGIVVGGGIAWGISRRSSAGEISRQRVGSFQQLAESHFHILTIWKWIATVPDGVAAAGVSFIELGRNRIHRRLYHEERVLQSPGSFAWEVALGGVSFLILASLFLWMKG